MLLQNGRDYKKYSEKSIPMIVLLDYMRKGRLYADSAMLSGRFDDNIFYPRGIDASEKKNDCTYERRES